MGRPRKTTAKSTVKKVTAPKKVAVEQKELVSTESETIASPDEISQDEYKPQIKTLEPKDKPFEFKDRFYYLTRDRQPVAHFLKSRKIIWFDEDKMEEREIMFTENQNTPFVDEFKGEVRPARMIFRDGVLHVPKNKVVWQKILSIYHDELGSMYLERDEEKEAADELDIIELELEALNTARDMDITKAESIVRMKEGSKVSSMSSKEIRRSLMLFCKENPELVLDLADDDNVEARNLGIKAVEQGILVLSKDHRTFMEGKSRRKLFDVPFSEHPYSALVQYFKTDEGLDVYSAIEKMVV